MSRSLFREVFLGFTLLSEECGVYRSTPWTSVDVSGVRIGLPENHPEAPVDAAGQPDSADPASAVPDAVRIVVVLNPED